MSVPIGNFQRYDQIWDLNGRLVKVQIKTSRWKDDSHRAFIFACYSTSNGHKHYYTPNEVDFFATYWEDEFYLVPIEECSAEKTLWLNSETAKGNHNHLSFAVNYKLEEMLKRI